MSLLQNPSEECVAMVLKEFSTTKDQVQDDLVLLRSWLQQQPHMPQTIDDTRLETMLVRCKCSVERTKKALDMHYTIKGALPDIFADRDPFNPDMQSIMDTVLSATLPNVTKDGYRVTILKNTSRDPVDFKPEIFFKYMMMIADIRFQEDRSVGDIYVYDFEFMGIGHISRISLPLLKKMELVAAEGYRARIKSVHFINAPAVVDVLLTMVKSVIKSKLASRHHVHNNLESFYKFVDRDMLPVEYGGKSKPLAEHSVDWKRKVESLSDWFARDEVTGRVDESKRPGKSFNSSEFFGFEGTFKKLNVD